MEKFNYKTGLKNPEIEAGKEWQASRIAEVREQLAKACDSFLNEGARLKRELDLLNKLEYGDDLASLDSAGDADPVYTKVDVEKKRAEVKKLEGQVRLFEDYIELQKSFLERAQENLAALKEAEAGFKKQVLETPLTGDLADISNREN